MYACRNWPFFSCYGKDLIFWLKATKIDLHLNLARFAPTAGAHWWAQLPRCHVLAAGPGGQDQYTCSVDTQTNLYILISARLEFLLFSRNLNNFLFQTQAEVHLFYGRKEVKSLASACTHPFEAPASHTWSYYWINKLLLHLIKIHVLRFKGEEDSCNDYSSRH